MANRPGTSGSIRHRALPSRTRHRTALAAPTDAPDRRKPPPERGFRVSGRPDLNRGPHRPERCALPGCATPRIEPVSHSEAGSGIRAPSRGIGPARWRKARSFAAKSRTFTALARTDVEIVLRVSGKGGILQDHLATASKEEQDRWLFT